MNIIDIVSFLTPHSTFQIGFLAILCILVIWTILGVVREAKPSGWDKKWQNGTFDNVDDDIDPDHGSIIDICAAIATRPEKMADVLPGILLMIGLLGTFIGLGISLDKASGIISNANSAGMDSALSNMKGMIQGLGTKFMTSTWGILGFLLFKSWSAFNNYEGRRLRWTISKMKSEMDQRRKKNDEIKKEESQRQLNVALSSKKLLEVIAAAISHNGNLISKIYDNGQSTNNSITNIIDLSKDISENRKKEQIRQINVAIEHKKLLDDLVQGISKNDYQLSRIFDNGQSTNSSIANMIDLSKEQIEKSIALDITTKEMSANTKEMSNSVISFIESNKQTIAGMKASGDKMSSAASEIGRSANNLDKAIGEFKGKVTEVLDNLTNNLGQTIQNMNSDFTINLEKVTTELGGATKSISEAVDQMSGGIKSTLDQVGESITNSIKVQQNAFSLFQTTSDTLNENIQQVTGQLSNVGNTISQGLTAVSDKRQEIKQATDGIKQALTHVESSSQAINSLIEGIKPAFSSQQKILEVLQKSNEHLENLKSKNLVPDKIFEQLDQSNVHLNDMKQALSNVKSNSKAISEIMDGINPAFSSQQKILEILQKSNEHLENLKSKNLVPDKIFEQLDQSNVHLSDMKQTLGKLIPMKREA